jgi:hypothetical protein
MYRAEIKKDSMLKHAAEFETVPECEAWITENYDYFPIGFVAEIIDVAAIKRKEKRVRDATARIEFGASIMAEIVAINEERLELGLLSEAQFTAMLNDPILYKVERLLWNGSLMSAKTLVEAMDDTHFNAAAKEYIVTKIAQFLLKLNEG